MNKKEIRYQVLSLVMAVVMYPIGGILAFSGFLSAYIAGAVLFPLLYPFLIVKSISSRALLLGILTAIPFSLTAYTGGLYSAEQFRIGWSLIYLLVLPSITAYLAIIFEKPVAVFSGHDVKAETRNYLAAMRWMVIGGVFLIFVLTVIRVLTGV
ncbi:MAG: hypothetical protein ABIH39_05190 [Candidatus Margulisiibacteriota bacterium]